MQRVALSNGVGEEVAGDDLGARMKAKENDVCKTKDAGVK